MALLCTLYVVSMLDRAILALLIQPISADLHLSYTQLGVLMGLSFGVLYALVGLPLAHVIDHGNRVWCLFSGVLLWSLTTVACGFAHDFVQLAIFRSGVAVGEAVLAPAAMSLIGDLFPLEKRAAPTVLYTSVATVMASGAFVFGGGVLSLAGTLAPALGLVPWRLTLIFVGLPGILLSLLLVVTVPEPARAAGPGLKTWASMRAAWANIVGERKLYGWVFVGVAAFTIVGTAFGAWTPTLFIRKFNLTTAGAGYLFGSFGMGMGILGALFWPWLITRSMRRGRPESLITTLAYTLGGATIMVAVVGLVSSVALAAVTAGMFYFLATTTSLVPPLIIQTAAPGEMRARLMAGNLLASNMIGAGIGPSAAAVIAEGVFHGSGALGYAFVVIALVTGPLAFVSFLLARRPYGVAYRAAASRESLLRPWTRNRSGNPQ